MTDEIRVLVADDHEPTRDEITLALNHDPRFTVCAGAGDAADAVRMAFVEQPDVCLLDIRMPGNGLRAAWEIHARLPRCKIVMLTVSDDDEDVLAALRAGACGYLLKEIDPRRLPRVLQSVIDGEVALPRALVGRLVEEFRTPHARRRSPAIDGPEGHLTGREWQVLDMLRSGMSTSEIADALVVAPVTVRTYVKAILEKLGLESRGELQDLFRASGGR